MEAALLRLAPGAADPEVINTVFRAAHSIKGGAGMFGFSDVAGFTHVLETLLDELRGERMAVTAPMCDGLLQSVDQIRAMLGSLQKAQAFDTSAADVLRRGFEQMIADHKNGDKARTAKPAAAAAAPIPAAAAVTAAPVAAAAADTSADTDRQRWKLGFRALPELLSRGNDPLRMFAELQGLGQLTVTADVSAVPELTTLD